MKPCPSEPVRESWCLGLAPAAVTWMPLWVVTGDHLALLGGLVHLLALVLVWGIRRWHRWRQEGRRTDPAAGRQWCVGCFVSVDKQMTCQHGYCDACASLWREMGWGCPVCCLSPTEAGLIQVQELLPGRIWQDPASVRSGQAAPIT
mmetsp:Transcript_5887/g.13961  ORF Transcript_5887/g.13961 Transcript_5887/m.13961 type:complete len:147 (+) Transcript_5887:45-485(+)